MLKIFNIKDAILKEIWQHLYDILLIEWITIAKIDEVMKLGQRGTCLKAKNIGDVLWVLGGEEGIFIIYVYVINKLIGNLYIKIKMLSYMITEGLRWFQELLGHNDFKECGN